MVVDLTFYQKMNHSHIYQLNPTIKDYSHIMDLNNKMYILFKENLFDIEDIDVNNIRFLYILLIIFL